MQVKIKHILPNPFRNIENYPFNRAKIEALKASYDRTDFWDNVVGRERNDGKVELGYGHHRWKALLEKYGPNHTVDIITKKLSDADMIVMMASENMDDWSTSAIVEIETVEAVVKAFAENKIKLPAIDTNSPDRHRRYAPSFIPRPNVASAESKMEYTAQTIGEFLGWVQPTGRPQRKIQIALTALQYIEEGIIELSAFKDMGTKGIEAVINEAARVRSYRESAARKAEELARQSRKEAEEAKREEEKARKDAEKYRRERQEAAERDARKREQQAARERERAEREEAIQQAEAAQERKEGKKAAGKVTKAVSEHIRSGGGTKTAGDVAIKAVPMSERKAPPRIEEYLRKALHEVGSFLFHGRDPVAERLRQVLEYKNELDEDVLENAENTLRQLAWRANHYADQFKVQSGRPIKETNNRRPLLKA
ncbi:MAG TPA: ParB N-terminal domain-containing protein [Chthoniobacterales bacterium]|nr:ParB N-terminal domain-containing protein [Chthoniobacterales bacterium]